MTDTESGESPADSRSTWTWGVGHNYISLFLTAIFLDRLAVGTLTVGGLVPSLIGAALGGLLAFALLYFPAASWGLQAGAGIDRVASATFGEQGARRLVGLLLALANVIWFAACLALAADYGKRGLIVLRLIEPNDVADWSLGLVHLKSPVILFETICWGVFAAVMGALLVRVVTAVTYTYPTFPALAIAAAFCLTLPGMASPTSATGPVSAPTISGAFLAMTMMIQYVTGFLAPSGLLGADWGSASRAPRDIVYGGFVGIAFAATIFAALSLTIVANTLGGTGEDAEPLRAAPDAALTAEARLARLLGSPSRPDEPEPIHREVGEPSLGAALQYGLGGSFAGVILLVLALGLLGPCVYAPYLFARFAGGLLPPAKPLILALVSVPAAWVLCSLGWVDSPPRIFGWMGAAFGPIAGAIAADYVRQRGQWPGPRPGWRPTAVLAWILGLAVGLAPEFGLAWAQPATILAFATAFLVELVLSFFSTTQSGRQGLEDGS